MPALAACSLHGMSINYSIVARRLLGEMYSVVMRVICAVHAYSVARRPRSCWSLVRNCVQSIFIAPSRWWSAHQIFGCECSGWPSIQYILSSDSILMTARKVDGLDSKHKLQW